LPNRWIPGFRLSNPRRRSTRLAEERQSGFPEALGRIKTQAFVGIRSLRELQLISRVRLIVLPQSHRTHYTSRPEGVPDILEELLLTAVIEGE
jgi:hypothetical protein